MGVRERLGAAPRAARNWGLVRPLLPAWPGAPAVVFLAFSTRPDGGNTTIRLPTADERLPKADERLPKADERLPKADETPTPRGLGPKSPQLRPNTVPSAHHHFAPPSRAARSRRPLAPSTRAARSRCPLAPPSRAVSPSLLLFLSLRVSTVHHPTRKGWKGAYVLVLRGTTTSTPSGGKPLSPPSPFSPLFAAHTDILVPLPPTHRHTGVAGRHGFGDVRVFFAAEGQVAT